MLQGQRRARPGPHVALFVIAEGPALGRCRGLGVFAVTYPFISGAHPHFPEYVDCLQPVFLPLYTGGHFIQALAELKASAMFPPLESVSVLLAVLGSMPRPKA